ncbi:Acg family FMN-binding oxidoreductase [Pseudonocardia thermophila]|nr:nitroreductase family protein [Pseudonocardia thermophila]
MTHIPAALGLTSDDVVRVLAVAGRAPSLHNSQPWRFRVEPDRIELWADPERRLPAADPHGREQRLACGAALFNLRLALHAHGIRPLVTLYTDRDPDLLAVVRHGGRTPQTAVQRELLAAVPRRRTNRHPFTDRPVTPAELTALRAAALAENAWLHVVTDPAERERLHLLSVDAHARQQADPAFREEFARWTAVDPNRSDGVPVLPHERRPSAHDRWVPRDFTRGAGATSAETNITYEAEPALVVLSAQMFGPTSEVAAGQALQRVLLTATTKGLSASFLSHIIEVEPTREQLRTLIHGTHRPQAVLRIGHGWPVSATPRRPAIAMVEVPGPAATT